MTFHILRTPMEEVVRKPSGKERWCFTCRCQRAFEFVVERVIDTPEEPSWYGPTRKIECATCHQEDADLFPGREREWTS